MEKIIKPSIDSSQEALNELLFEVVDKLNELISDKNEGMTTPTLKSVTTLRPEYQEKVEEFEKRFGIKNTIGGGVVTDIKIWLTQTLLEAQEREEEAYQRGSDDTNKKWNKAIHVQSEAEIHINTSKVMGLSTPNKTP